MVLTRTISSVPVEPRALPSLASALFTSRKRNRRIAFQGLRGVSLGNLHLFFCAVQNYWMHPNKVIVIPDCTHLRVSHHIGETPAPEDSFAGLN
jgi:hypothetical protein